MRLKLFRSWNIESVKLKALSRRLIPLKLAVWCLTYNFSLIVTVFCRTVQTMTNNNNNRDGTKSLEIIPKDLRSARACLVCSLIKSFEQFEFDGCDNCDEFLRMKNNRDNIYDCTSSKFEGMIALMSPEDSWVAKWQRINRFTKGVYAISVAGRLPPSVVREMKNRGITYRSRDMSNR